MKEIGEALQGLVFLVAVLLLTPLGWIGLLIIAMIFTAGK